MCFKRMFYSMTAQIAPKHHEAVRYKRMLHGVLIMTIRFVFLVFLFENSAFAQQADEGWGGFGRSINMLLQQPNIQPSSLATIVCPVLVMAGQRDVIKEGHTTLIASNIKNAQLVIFSKGTHYEPLENPDRFNRTVIAFLKGLKK